MQHMERLLPDLELHDEPSRYSTRFWIAFGLFIITIATGALFAFFYFVVMGHK
jgi:hypothetical protein